MLKRVESKLNEFKRAYLLNTRAKYCGPSPLGGSWGHEIEIQTFVFLHSEAQSNVLQPQKNHTFLDNFMI